MNDPHPLDQDYGEGAEQLQVATEPPITNKDSSSGPSRSILRTSLIALAITGLVVFLSGVAASNASPNSTTETLASGVNRFATLLLLVAFLGILLAYQYPNIQKLLAKLNEPERQQPPGSENPAVGFLAEDPGVAGLPNQEHTHPRTVDSMPPMLGEFQNVRMPKRDAEFLILLSINLLVLFSLWGLGLIAFTAGLMNYFGFIIFPVLFLSPGLLVTMIVWNRGCSRAYAIGALSAFLGLYFTASYLPMLFFGGGAFGRGSTSAGYFLGLGLGITGVIVSGLISAGYVRLLLTTRKSR